MLMYGKEASNRKQEIDRQHHTIPNQRNQRAEGKQAYTVPFSDIFTQSNLQIHFIDILCSALSSFLLCHIMKAYFKQSKLKYTLLYMEDIKLKKIAIIEDDTDIRNMITKFLINHNYEVYSAPDGREGIDLCQKFLPDLVILDLMLPILNGDSVIKQLRIYTDIPVIVVSAKTMVQSKIDLLRLGADDYMTKPFNLFELLARIEANLKRSAAAPKKADIHLKYKDIEVENCNAYVKGASVQFTSTELSILILLLQYPQKIFSKQNIYESIWQEEYAYDNDTINTHISNIRKKIKKHTDTDYIETVWGIGYKLK